MPDSELPALIEPEAVVTADGERRPIALIELDTLASWIDQLRDMKRDADTAIAAISAEVVRRADLSVRTQVDGIQRWVRVTGSQPTPRWHPEGLLAALRSLRDTGVLSEEAVAGVVRRETVWKVDTTAMKRLTKNPAVKAATDPHLLESEEPVRRVTGTGWLT